MITTMMMMRKMTTTTTMMVVVVTRMTKMKAIVMVVLKVEAHGGDVSDGDNDSDHNGEKCFQCKNLENRSFD